MIWYDMIQYDGCKHYFRLQFYVPKLEIIALLYINSNMTFKTAGMRLKRRNILDETLVLYQKKLNWPGIY